MPVGFSRQTDLAGPCWFLPEPFCNFGTRRPESLEGGQWLQNPFPWNLQRSMPVRARAEAPPNGARGLSGLQHSASIACLAFSRQEF